MGENKLHCEKAESIHPKCKKRMRLQPKWYLKCKLFAITREDTKWEFKIDKNMWFSKSSIFLKTNENFLKYF